MSESSDSNPGVLRGTTDSGERVAVRAPRPSWADKVSVVQLVLVVFAAGGAIVELRDIGKKLDVVANQVSEHDKWITRKDAVDAERARVRALDQQHDPSMQLPARGRGGRAP